jgi:peptidoglycan/xylan/chitin deacetylase (PgdA/CDA1 family)
LHGNGCDRIRIKAQAFWKPIFCKALSTNLVYANIMTTSFKTRALRAALSTIAYSRIGNMFPSAGGRGVIFTLHHVRPKTDQSFDPNAHLEITPDFLEEAILAVKEAGLIPVRLTDLPDLLINGDARTRYACFTLDDGYKNNEEYAAPLFRKYDVPYTIFICPGFVQQTRSMWWETIAALLQANTSISFDFGRGLEQKNVTNPDSKQAIFNRFSRMVRNADEDHAISRIDEFALSLGLDPLEIVKKEVMNSEELMTLSTDPLCTFGGHSLTHCNLARVSAERLHREIKESCDLVSGYSGKKVEAFAYPYGLAHAAGAREFAAAADVGLKIGVTTRAGVLRNSNIETPTAFRRISLNGLYQEKHYVNALTTGLLFSR